ncbi:hypothetical protein [Chryseobacterium wangxinyae]|uniref:hypothetical protein n=1 Tax=Chryseobacterium sp. CY353 TaxID=2997334 RepID=UPI00227145B6|nr:hypothetical protein [Chryseobacterium sp. CY353]MCY0969787.1 hypothetical protein [Chryseobacterium sp. CY353]
MKNLLFGILFGCFALMGCRSDEDSIQKIDQIMSFYIQDANGKNLLIPNKIGSFTSVAMNDLLATTDNAPVSNSLKSISDSVSYIEYIAGATRQLESGGDSDNRMYRSQIRVALTKKLTDTTFAEVDNDTLQIFYHWTPSVFEVSRVLYNKSELPINKDSESRNVVKITK